MEYRGGSGPVSIRVSEAMPVKKRRPEMAEFSEDALRGDIINHTGIESYVVPKEEAVRNRLEWFRDQKLGFMVHWGIYSQLGMTESWPLSREDAVWSRSGYDWEKDDELFRRQYVDMNRSFNPLRFEPEKWAEFARDVGFRYFIFTTKHHDGFCMWDTKYTDYKVTDPSCPFHTHRYANIAKQLFDAFRKQGIALAPYFSKPDWHCPWYWAPGCDLPVAHWRNPTYDPRLRPELWQKFIDFTWAQLTEIAEDLGPVDILWLDGGQVNPRNHQDIRLMELVNRLRKKYPALLVADRTVGGETENYITPEQQVPSHYIPVPWESCVTIGHSFAFSFEDTLKTRRELVHLLIDVVSKGGNLALNIGAQPDGRLPLKAMVRARELGDWLKENGQAIFSTRPYAPYFQDRWSYTCTDGDVYCMLRLKEDQPLGTSVSLPLPGVTALYLLTGEKLETCPGDNGLRVRLPERFHGTVPDALVLRMPKA